MPACPVPSTPSSPQSSFPFCHQVPTAPLLNHPLGTCPHPPGRGATTTVGDTPGVPHPGVPHRGQVPWAAHTTASSLRQHLGQAREAQRTDHSYLRAPPSPPQLPAPPPSGLDIHWMLCPVEHAPLLLVKTTQARTLSTHPPPIRTPCPPTPGPSTPSWPLTCPLCPLQEGVLRPPG